MVGVSASEITEALQKAARLRGKSRSSTHVAAAPKLARRIFDVCHPFPNLRRCRRSRSRRLVRARRIPQ